MLIRCLTILGFLFCASSLHAQDQGDASLPPERKAQVIDALIEELAENYVYAERVPQLAAQLKGRDAKGRYPDAQNKSDFARALSKDLVELTEDHHFVVEFSPETSAGALFALDDPNAAKRANFGFEELKILPGNVGYLRFDHFPDPTPAFQTITAAMRFVENVDALIIDLRYNNGGYLEAAQFIASHLFIDDEDRKLFSYFYNEDGKTIAREKWVMAAIPGKRRPKMPVYVLTSSTTFSAGEWLAFTLKENERATLVGQTTTGAAHPVNRFRLNEEFVAQIPIGKIFGPVSESDFEGVGVVPHHDLPSHRAFDAAYVMALQVIGEKDDGEDAAWFLPFARASTHDPEALEADRNAIRGRYEGREIGLEDGVLVYRWRGRFSLSLYPLGDGVFAVEGTEDYRFKLVYENGAVTGLERHDKSGGKAYYAKLD